MYAFAAAAALRRAVCTSAGHDSAASTAPSQPKDSGVTILFLSAPLSLEGANSTKLGAAAAADALGVSYQYLAPPSLDNFTSDYTALINQAIARHPSAMVIGNFIPAAFDPLIKKASANGIPVVVEDTGITTWQSDGAIGFVGPSFDTVGTDAAQSMIKDGARHLLCVDQTTNPFIESICTTAKKVMNSAGGTYAQLNAPLDDLSNPAALTQDIQGYLASHPRIDGVFTAGGGFGVDAATAVANLNKSAQIKVGGNEVLPTTLPDIKSGSIAFEISNEPYLEGWGSLQAAAQYARYKILPSTAIITNGAVVNRGNVSEYMAVSARYPGVFG